MQGDSLALDLIYRKYYISYRLQNLAKSLINNSLFLTDSSINLHVLFFTSCKTIIFSNGELVTVSVFREGFGIISRQVFGIHPTTNKLLVPIDLCILSNNNTSPNFGLDVLDTKVLDVNTSREVGTIKNFSVPPEGNINPVVELNTDGIDLLISFPDDIFKKIIFPTITIRAGNLVTLNENTSVKGNILPLISAGQSLINTFPFYSTNSGFTFKAFKIKFNQGLRPKDIGSPIIMEDGSTLGMLVSLDKDDTSIAFISPSSLLQVSS